MSRPVTTLVVPTVGRPSLHVLLRVLADARPMPWPVLVVDDRDNGVPLDLGAGGPDVTVLRSGGGGPARARNLGWRHARTPWVSFLDDDVVPTPTWVEQLAKDLGSAGDEVAGMAGRVVVPLPTDRRPTDWERTTAGLETSRWITADLSYRRTALADVGGFDERFHHAFREDADLGLRVTRACGDIVMGSREVLHPPRPADFWVSVRQQQGNADDALMRALHGPRWHELVGAPRGRRPRHVAVTLAGTAALGALVARRPRLAVAPWLAWLAGTAELAVARIAPGPRTPGEITRMTTTSAVLPAAATWHTLRGIVRHRRARPWRGVPDLVLFDRDGTLVHDVPYNGDPALVHPVPAARPALDRLRAAGVRVGLVTNQSGLATGKLTGDQFRAVQQRVVDLLGPFDVVEMCPHAPEAGCDCRKPRAGMVLAACGRLEVSPSRCVVVGDIESDVLAARAAGACGWLVPNLATRTDEVARATRSGSCAGDLGQVTDRLLAGAW